VAVVTHRMAASVRSRARFVTRGWRRSAINRRIDDLRSAATTQLVKRHVGTSATIAAMTNILTPVSATGEDLVAGERTSVVDVDATLLAALVASAAALLVAPPVATRVVRPR